MPTDMKRFMLSVPIELEQRAEELKKREFYDKPYSEMYRQLITVGLKCFQERANNTSQPT